MTRSGPLALAALLAISGLIFELRTSAQHNEAQNLARRVAQMRAFAASVDINGLTIRVSSVPSYDAPVKNLQALERMFAEVDALLPPDCSVESTAFASVLTTRALLLDELKSKRSATRNSERYLRAYVSRDDADTRVPIPLSRLLLSSSGAEALEVKALELENPVLMRHLAIIADFRHDLDELVMDMAREDLASAAAAIEARLFDGRTAAETNARKGRAAFLLLISLLLAFELWRARAIG